MRKRILKGTTLQNTISHCINSNETQNTLHFFQSRISIADLILAISKTGMCLLTLLVFLTFFYFSSQLT